MQHPHQRPHQHPHQRPRKKPSSGGLWNAKKKDSPPPPIPPYPAAQEEAEAYDALTYGSQGYGSQAYDPEGYDPEGYDPETYKPETYGPEGYDSQGYDSQGYGLQGYEHSPGTPTPSPHEQSPYEQNEQNSYTRNYQPRPEGRGHPRAPSQASRPSQSARQPQPSQPTSVKPAPSVRRSPKRAVQPPQNFYDSAYDDEFVPNFRAQPYKSRRADYRFWVLGGVLLVGLTILIEPTRVISSMVKTNDYDCQEVVQPRSVLSREQLTQLLTIPERSTKDKVRAVMEEPYCLMPSVMIRAGVPTVREAYPLEFDPDMWIVMLYEGDEYAGYRFNAR